MPLSLVVFAGCGYVAPTEVSTSTPITPGTMLPYVNNYELPTSIDPAEHYLFYLHGKIIEDQGLHAVSPVFGEYEYESILKRLQETGAAVISELRAKDTAPATYAARIKDQVRQLKEEGVPSEHITVVGASKGAYIAALSSYVLRDPKMNFVLLATCYPGMVSEWTTVGMHLYGNVLAIRDVADVGNSGSCEELFQFSENKGLGRHEEIVLQVGTGHGIVYHPLDEWILPTLEWASR